MPTATNDLTPTAAKLKKALGAKPITAAEWAAKIGRLSATGLGPVMVKLSQTGHAVRHEDGTYSKVKA